MLYPLHLPFVWCKSVPKFLSWSISKVAPFQMDQRIMNTIWKQSGKKLVQRCILPIVQLIYLNQVDWSRVSHSQTILLNFLWTQILQQPKCRMNEFLALAFFCRILQCNQITVSNKRNVLISIRMTCKKGAYLFYFKEIPCCHRISIEHRMTMGPFKFNTLPKKWRKIKKNCHSVLWNAFETLIEISDAKR